MSKGCIDPALEKCNIWPSRLLAVGKLFVSAYTDVQDSFRDFMLISLIHYNMVCVFLLKWLYSHLAGKLLVQLYYPSQVEPCIQLSLETSVVTEDRITSVYSAPSCKGTSQSLFVACYDTLCGGFVDLIYCTCYNQDLSNCPSFVFILVETVDYVGNGVSSRW